MGLDGRRIIEDAFTSAVRSRKTEPDIRVPVRRVVVVAVGGTHVLRIAVPAPPDRAVPALVTNTQDIHSLELDEAHPIDLLRIGSLRVDHVCLWPPA
ncbi:MAG: hypothetical protein KTR25_20040 [Myxococcales bacterium]|nr:hypothetical protein [Myxococcales bacterium]